MEMMNAFTKERKVILQALSDRIVFHLQIVKKMSPVRQFLFKRH